MTIPLLKAFKHVKSIFPTLSIVIINRQGQWLYMDENFVPFNFENKNVDMGLLEDGADSITHTPFIYQEEIE